MKDRINPFVFLDKRQRQQKCPHRLKQSPPTVSSITTVPIMSQSITESSLPPTVDLPNHHHSSSKTNEKIEISIDRFQSSSANKKMSFNLIDFGRDFTFETLAHFSSSSSSTDNAMTICENNYFIYSQNFNELIILSLNQSAHPIHTQLKKNTIIRDLSYVEWLNKCLIITDEEIYLFDYQTIQYDIIDSGVGYICGTIDNLNSIFYLIKQTTIYKYDRNCLIDYKVDQYPIVDSYQSQRLILDNKTNEYLALLVNTNDEKHAILIYSTKSLDNGYLYKIMIDDRIERKWLCSNGNHGWLIQGTYPGSCFDLNIHGLNSIRVFNCNQIHNMITMNEHQCFFIRTNTDIFMLKKIFFVNLNK